MTTRTLLLIALLAHEAAARPAVTCKDIESAHQQAESSTGTFYNKALAAESLSPVALERVPVPDAESEQDVDKKIFGKPVKPWQPFPFKNRGKQLTVIVDEPYNSTDGRRTDVEFGKNKKGELWRIRRAPRVRKIKSVTVKACAWGCWGRPGSGMERDTTFTRDVWVVPPDLTYRGEIEIAYEAPTLDIKLVDQNCPLPP